MSDTLPTYPRILGIAPSRRGFGFVVMEGLNTLVDWEVKWITGDKNKGLVAKAERIVDYYQPHVLVLENAATKGSFRCKRIQMFTTSLIAMAKKRKLHVVTFTKEEMRRAFSVDGKGARHGVAKIIAGRFPDELGVHLPPKRTVAMDENYWMSVFDAAALALMVRKTSFRAER